MEPELAAGRDRPTADRELDASSPPSVLLVTGNGDAPNCRAVIVAVSLWLLGRGALGISYSSDLLTSTEELYLHFMQERIRL